MVVVLTLAVKPPAVAVTFGLTEGLDVGIKARVSIMNNGSPSGLVCLLLFIVLDEVKVKPALVHLTERLGDSKEKSLFYP